ncbi:SIR2 family protein [Nocardioides marmoribigeumensis]|uniref:NAD-dependent SIR2 family protein deacetylase n=1 Tax=Nocardioides marmoribigeumensis TaxID=433649 RepID=A0ABU2BY97_9ACTN|nr:SIR2 family protein [Nocardioides marmoribigeumensis]MDR7363354.1 NAD-dependent SIR2 family protein deacetylase [Nocardioides marmoribigeumensis]
MASSSGMTAAGHVFVVHGRIENLTHDVAVLPTSTKFSFRPYWHPILSTNTEQWRPDGWPAAGFARAKGRDDIWFVNVGGRSSHGADALVDRSVGALRDIAATRPTPSRNRTKALVAFPVIGIEGGGLGQERGDVVRRLLPALTEAARELDLDIALVTPDSSVYAAAQHLRRQASSWALPENQIREAERLGEIARSGGLALFMGAGVSIPAGLPTWGGLLAQLAERHRVDTSGKFQKLSGLDQAQYLHNHVENLGMDVCSIVETVRTPALGHALLASLGCAEAVTTNYDRLYEAAVLMQRGPGNVATVLPWEHPDAGKQWILKLHGDVQKPASIVLTRQQFVSFDAQTRPAGALLQTLLMTRHVLFVGASLTDDNVIRLAYEVDHFRRSHDLAGTVGTVLDVEDDEVRRELWRDQLFWVSMAGDDVQQRSRTLEVFLDAVAAHASSDASWLLDERFSGLSDADRDLAAAAREVYNRASGAGPEWKGLADSLARFGARSGR